MHDDVMKDEGTLTRLVPRPAIFCLCVTNRCNIRCSHCIYGCGPNKRRMLPLVDCKRVADEAKAFGYSYFLISGGEPFLSEQHLLQLVAHAAQWGLSVVVGTNGFWGKEPESCRRTVAALKSAGLSRLGVSTDRFHEEFIPLSAVLQIAEEATRVDLPVDIVTVVVNNENPETRLLAILSDARVGITARQLAPYGRAAQLSRDLFPPRPEMGKTCLFSFVPTVFSDGRVFACCGPCVMAPRSHPLWIGSIFESSLQAMLAKQEGDSLLQAIKVLGGARAIELLLPDFRPPEPRGGIETLCTRCISVWSDKRLQEKARSHLAVRSDIRKEITVLHMVLRQELIRAGKRWNLPLAAGSRERYDLLPVFV